MSYEDFRHKYATWLSLTPKVHTLSPLDPVKACYFKLGRDIHAIPRETLAHYLESYHMEQQEHPSPDLLLSHSPR